MGFEDELKNRDHNKKRELDSLPHLAHTVISHFRSNCIRAADRGLTNYSQFAQNVDGYFLYSYPSSFNLTQTLFLYRNKKCTDSMNTTISTTYGSFHCSYEDTFISLLKSELSKYGFENARVVRHKVYAAKQEQSEVKSFWTDKTIRKTKNIFVSTITLFQISTHWN